MNMALLGSLTLSALALGGCGYRTVAPAEAPAAEWPRNVEVLRVAPLAGTTRVVLDANGEPATVSEIVDNTSFHATVLLAGTSAIGTGRAETSKTICLAPCMVDLTPGLHTLDFDGRNFRGSRIIVQVGDEPKVVRQALGHTDIASSTFWWGEALAILGGVSVATGAAIWAGGDTLNAQPAGQATMVAGAAAVVAGVALAVINQPTEQSGSTTIFAWK